MLYQLFEALLREPEDGDGVLADLLAGEQAVRCVRFHKGSDIVTAFDPAVNCYFIYQGEYQETNYSAAGQKNVLAVRRAPQFIGIVPLLDRLPHYGNNMEALTDVKAVEIDNTFFERELEADGQLGLLMLRNLAAKVIEASQKLQQRSFWGARENFLLYLYRQYSIAGGQVPFVLTKSNRCVAEELGISERTVYRVINDLRDEGLVQVKNGNIVLSESAVSSIAEQTASLL